MPRIARIVLPHVPHLVAQRGNRGERLFPSAGDRRLYLDILGEYLRDSHVQLWAYRLEISEVQLVLLPQDLASMGKCLRNAHGLYSQLMNRRLATTGHLFQGRFYSCPLDPACAQAAVKYLERPASPAGASHSSLACRAARLHLPAEDHPADCQLCSLLSDQSPLPTSAQQYEEWVGQSPDPALVNTLLARLRVGKPAGSAAFIHEVEILTGLNLSRRRGRPRKVVPVDPASVPASPPPGAPNVVIAPPGVYVSQNPGVQVS